MISLFYFHTPFFPKGSSGSYVEILGNNDEDLERSEPLIEPTTDEVDVNQETGQIEDAVGTVSGVSRNGLVTPCVSSLVSCYSYPCVLLLNNALVIRVVQLISAQPF